MRIIAGYLGGRSFKSPTDNRTHPMSDKVRGALFNSLGDISDLTILDAFAGSGALSFEAASRGAHHITAIESDSSAQRTITENIASLNLKAKISLIRASSNAWLTTTDDVYDVIILDPPYDKLQINLLYKLANMIKLHGVVVISLPPSGEIIFDESYDLLSKKSFGDAQLVFYRRTK